MKTGSIGNAVREARQEAGLTQADLASACMVTRQTVGLIEAGSYNPTVKLALLIAKRLGKNVDRLFWLEGQEHE